jgi:HAD superfamily hydrolase (TIGR01509 family)
VTIDMSRPPLPKAFDLLIFDCDGVLVDSEVLACRAVSGALAEFGLSLPVDEIAERFLGRSSKDMYAELEAEWRGVLSDAVKSRIRAHSAELFDRELQPIDGIAAALDALSGPRCVASSSGPEAIAYKLRRTDLARCFEPVSLFSAHMVSRGKPEPDLFLHAAERMGADPVRCLVIEDSVPGVTAAKAAGMIAFGFIGASHCRAGHADRLSAAGADLIFAEMRALPSLVAQRNATFTTS